MKKIMIAVCLLTALTACNAGPSAADKDIAMLAGKVLFIRDYIETNKTATPLRDEEGNTSFEIGKLPSATSEGCEQKETTSFCKGYIVEVIDDIRQNGDRKEDGTIDPATIHYQGCLRISALQKDEDGKYNGIEYTTYITAPWDKPFYDTCSAKKIGPSRKACENLGGRPNGISTWTTVDYDVPADKAAQIKRVAI